MRKPKDWEPQYIQVPIEYLQGIIEDIVDTTLSSYQGGGTGTTIGSDLAVINLLTNIKDMIMPLSASVQNLVDQVAASKSIEASSAAALVQLVTQSKALSDQVAALTAAGTGMSAADAAAITKAATDLHDSATALQAAVPASVSPSPAPAPVIPPAV